MKFSSRTSALFRIAFFVEGCLLFSFLASYGVMVAMAIRRPANRPEYGLADHRHLRQNYRIIREIMEAQEAIQPPSQSAADLLAAISLDATQPRSVPAPALEDILAQQADHPYFGYRRRLLVLQRLYAERRYGEFIRFYTNPRNLAYLHAWNLDALQKTGQAEAAQAAFKALALASPNMQVIDFLESASARRLIASLDEDFWLKRFSALKRSEEDAELRRELPYASRYPQLVTLYRAHFLYQRRSFSQCRALCRRLAGTKYQTRGEALQLKIDLREGKDANTTGILEKLRPDTVWYSDTLQDIAGLLLIKRDYAGALRFYERFLKVTPESNENRWKILWITAWIHQRQGNRSEAERLFEEGCHSPIFNYRVASLYWKSRLGVSKGRPLPRYPLSYYSMKTYGLALFSQESRQNFQNLLNQRSSSQIVHTVDLVRQFIHAGAWEEALDLVDWCVHEPNISRIDQKMLVIIKSVLLYRQNALRQTYIHYRDFFAMDVPGSPPLFLSKIFYPIAFQEQVVKYSRLYGVDPSLIMALIRQESFFQAGAISSAKAMGVMQLIYGTAQIVAREAQMRIRRQDLFNPDINIHLGIHHFNSLLAKYGGKVYLALAAYNAGDARVDQWLSEFGHLEEEEFIEMIPITQTRNYVKNILLHYFVYMHYYEFC